MVETTLDIARRHVREGLERIERQKRVIVLFESLGTERTLLQARAFLATMLELQAEFEAHLAELERCELQRS